MKYLFTILGVYIVIVGQTQSLSSVIKKVDSLISVTEYEQAEKLLNQISDSGSEFEKAITQTRKGFLYLNKGRYDIALDNLHQALSRFQLANKQNSGEGAICLSTLGLVYGSTRKYKQAEENHLLALQIREQIFGAESEEVAASYNDLGLIYFETDPDKSLEYLEKALITYKKLHGDSHPKIAIASTNIGFAYRKLELFGDAIVNFENAKALWEKIYPNGHPNQALVLSYLGQTYRQMNDSKTSQSYFNMALAIYKKSYGGNHPDIANTYTELGILELGERHYKESINYFQLAIISNSPNFKNTNISTNPPYSEYYNGTSMLYSLRYKAQSLEEQYYGSTLKLEDLKIALSCLHTCDSLIDDIRHQSTDESDKIALGEIANEVYEDAVRISIAISEVTFDSKKYREEAFYFAEKSKSAVLHESIAEVQAKSFAGIPNELLEQEKNLKSTISYLIQKLAQKPEASEEKKLRANLFSLNQEYNAFIKKLESEFPNYFDLKYNQTTPTITTLQDKLDNNNCIISFFIAEKNNRIYLFIITKNQLKIANHLLPEGFEKQIRGFNNSLFYSDFDTYQQSAGLLSKILIPKLSSSIKHVTIIPSGKLGTMPFEALPVTLKGVMDFKEVEYLIQKYSISYEFSSTLMLQKENQTSQTSTSSIFLCAPVKFNPEDNLNELPGTEKEVSEIAKLFGSTSMVALFQEANETSIKMNELSKYNYIHFATHGIVDEMAPELSRIFLNSGNKDDGHLYSGEIFNLQLNAELAVLSACQTGLGKLSKGEGVIGLSRALTYAGAKNLVVSFWSVSDESTSELMTYFYERILKNKDNFSNALRSSKLHLISNPNFAAPYYWAPFVMIGN